MFDVKKTKDVLFLLSKIFKYVSIFLFLAFLISLFTSFIHPLFWISLFFGSFGVYGSAYIRATNLCAK